MMSAMRHHHDHHETEGPRQAPTIDDRIYTCPMHPEVRQKGPGFCPKCGMALEPEAPTTDEGPNAELMDMTRRFWVSVVLTLPLLALAMAEMFDPALVQSLPTPLRLWGQLLLAAPVVLWGGWPFFVRGWQSIVNRSPNMFTLIALGVGVAFGYSLVAVITPNVFPPSFRDQAGRVGTYFEAAAAIVILVLLGPMVEL